MAMNKKAIVDAIFQGAGTVAKTFIPPGELGSAQDIKHRPYDPAGATKLLAQAGFPDGFTTTLWAGSATRGYNPNQKPMAELIQAQWAEIGVKASIVFYEWGDYLTRTRKGEQDAFLLGGTSDNGDPDNLATYFLSCDGAKDGSNRSRWCYKPYEDLLIEGRRVTDPTKRAEIYVKAQEIALDETPRAPIAHGNLYMPICKTVKELRSRPFRPPELQECRSRRVKGRAARYRTRMEADA
jgi:dipeptide transport system substrate-binding protein